MRIVEMTSEQLRHFIQDRHEKAFALIDVRQPGEYAHGHIPGARLIPLPELVRTMDSLPRDKELVFYCHSGGRSLAAAAMVADEEIAGQTLYNLTGGILAWDGGLTADFPRVQLFGGQDDTRTMLQTAMNLEKGALNFYTRVHGRYEGQPWVKVFADLALAEIGHAKTVFHFLRQIEPSGDGFDQVFGRLSGDVLEGGMPLESALQKLSTVQGRICMRLIEVALQMEYAAYDLYRTMADRTGDTAAREAFMTIAQSEKTHMRTLVRAIDTCSD
jgi:rhodanese-related sulfurtransferase/rubrerythrin